MKSGQPKWDRDRIWSWMISTVTVLCAIFGHSWAKKINSPWRGDPDSSLRWQVQLSKYCSWFLVAVTVWKIHIFWPKKLPQRLLLILWGPVAPPKDWLLQFQGRLQVSQGLVVGTLEAGPSLRDRFQKAPQQLSSAQNQSLLIDYYLS